jgi:Helitron helicase-like domain at N-terminus
MGESYIPDHQNIYLSSSFLGSNRWASEQISDSLAIAAAYGPPTFFVTFTCNANWPKIRNQLRPGQDFIDVPIVVARVFRHKLAALELTLKSMFPNAGRLLYMVHSVEFQKRGLPHAHILLKFEKDCIHPDDIDSIINAEMPSNSEDAQLVNAFMMHSHPPLSKEPSKYCQKLDGNGNRYC